MSLITIKTELKKIETLKKKILKDIKKDLTDVKNYTPEERWEIFVECGENGILKHDGYIISFKDKDVQYWFREEFLPNRDKYETMYMDQLVDSCEDDQTPELVEKLKEECMKSLIWSFEYDW